MSWSMGSISQNVSNVNTIGYKRKDTEFKTMLSESHSAPTGPGGGLDIFGVHTADRYAITAQGVITPSDKWSDMAINGRGFFIVSQPSSTDPTTGQPAPPATLSLTDAGSVLYTRAGDFREFAVHTATTTTGTTTSSSPSTSPGTNDTTYLTTSSGQFLMGWKADAWGRIAGEYTSAQTPVPPSTTTTTATTTTTTATGGTKTLVPISWQPNMLQNGAATTAMQMVFNLPSNMPASTGIQTADTTVNDLTNTAQTLRTTWTRTGADTWDVSFSLPNNPGINIMSTQPVAVTFDANGNITTPTGGTTNLDIDWDGNGIIDPVLTPNESQQAVNLSTLKPTTKTTPLTLSMYDNAYNAQTVTANFERWSTDKWAMTISVPATNGTLTDLQVGTGTTTTTPTTPPATTTPVVIPLTFDGAGNLTSPTAGKVTMTVNWSATGAGTSTVTMDIAKLTQLADSSDKISIKSIDQDGYSKGMLSGMTVSQYGEVIGQFTNGKTRTLYKIPVATFAAPDSLDPVSGTLFRRTEEAGAVTVDSVDDQGSGSAIVGSATESSNVKIEDEFTKMIITQKAYSTNAQVFKTADEMTTAVRDLIS
ncbi:MAG: flagellar hook-basal body complex protein [Actinomycetota bacterium]